MILVAQDAEVILQSVEDTQYGDIVLDGRGTVWERQHDYDHPGEFEWWEAAGDVRLHARRKFSDVLFPVRLLARHGH